MMRLDGVPADTRPTALINNIAVVAALGGAVYFVGTFIYIALSRLGYPFALEWLEGGSYAQVQRLLTGQPLYAPPSMEYVAMIYPPLYYNAAALLSRAVGFSFVALRLISLGASLGALVVIFALVRQSTGGSLAAAVASGMFAASYHLSGSWFDIARVDMLAVFLVLLALWLLRMRNPVWHVLGAFAYASACLTKQIHLVTLACVIAYLAVFERKRLATFVVPCLALLGAAVLILDRIYDGWFSFFVLKLALGSGEYVALDPGAFSQTAREFWLYSILLAWPIAALGILGYVVAGLRQGHDRPGLLFYVTCGAGLVATSWFVVQVGGYRNDLIPAYAAMAMLAGIALNWLMALAGSASLRYAALLGACVWQFAILWYPVAPQIPSEDDRLAGNGLLEQIRGQRGDVYVPFHPELALMAGKEPFASWSPLYQLEGNFGGGDIRLAGRVKAAFTRSMERKQFSMLILDQEPNWIWGDPEKYYTRSDRPVFADQDVFWPVTGWPTRPEIIMLPIAVP